MSVLSWLWGTSPKQWFYVCLHSTRDRSSGARAIPSSGTSVHLGLLNTYTHTVVTASSKDYPLPCLTTSECSAPFCLSLSLHRAALTPKPPPSNLTSFQIFLSPGWGGRWMRNGELVSTQKVSLVIETLSGKRVLWCDVCPLARLKFSDCATSPESAHGRVIHSKPTPSARQSVKIPWHWHEQWGGRTQTLVHCYLDWSYQCIPWRSLSRTGH